MICESFHPSPLIEALPVHQKKLGSSHRRRNRLTDSKPFDPWLLQSIPREGLNDFDPSPPPELAPSAIRAKGRRGQERSLTEAKRKEKESRAELQSNIFKQGSTGLGRLSKEDVRLPALDSRHMEDQPQGRKIVRIALDKLKRLQPEEVKKRFLLKYQLSHQL